MISSEEAVQILRERFGAAEQCPEVIHWCREYEIRIENAERVLFDLVELGVSATELYQVITGHADKGVVSGMLHYVELHPRCCHWFTYSAAKTAGARLLYGPVIYSVGAITGYAKG